MKISLFWTWLESLSNTMKVSYEVAIPWKEKSVGLQNNFEMAEKRLYNLEKKLSKEPEIAQEYGKIINQYLEKGYVTKVSIDEDRDPVKWYLPHFPVVKEDRSTTKVRIVFDASAKCNGTALNDVMDDSMDSVIDETEGVELYKELSEL